jgi:hypothetical protein
MYLLVCARMRVLLVEFAEAQQVAAAGFRCQPNILQHLQRRDKVRAPKDTYIYVHTRSASKVLLCHGDRDMVVKPQWSIRRHASPLLRAPDVDACRTFVLRMAHT